MMVLCSRCNYGNSALYQMFRHPGVIIPPLPEKSVVQKYQMTTDFIEQRRAALTLFINKVVRMTREYLTEQRKLCVCAHLLLPLSLVLTLHQLCAS